MSHRLCPPEDALFSNQRRLSSACARSLPFAMQTDQGVDDVGDLIAKLIELKAPKPIIDAAIAGRDRSYSVTVADDTTFENYLSFIVRPGKGPLIGYHSAQHEVEVRELVGRCAKVLDYEIFLV